MLVFWNIFPYELNRLSQSVDGEREEDYEEVRRRNKDEALCEIWYHLCNLHNVKNTHGGVILSVSCRLKPATLLQISLFHVCF